MISPDALKLVTRKFELLGAALDERQRRLWAAAEAIVLGHGGITGVAAATGLARSTVWLGVQELEGPAEDTGRVRREGAGRKRISETQPGILDALNALVEPSTRGDPQSALRWTCKSTRKLAEELVRQGFTISHEKVAQLLADLGYSLQATRKTTEGKQHPDRNAQFEHLNATVKKFQKAGQPVISVDTKKKELIGDFANKGREYQPKGKPETVRVHDFPDPELGKAIPYGVYDVTRNVGWVSVGQDHDTASFAVTTIGEWWRRMGQPAYKQAKRILVTADGGGSNSSRSRLWKLELQRLADTTDLSITVCHLPPGTSKWNKIEHRLFSHITQNWRGRPLSSHEVAVSLIANTTTAAGLQVEAALDEGEYPKGRKVPDPDFDAIRITRDKFHGDWNYTIRPRKNR